MKSEFQERKIIFFLILSALLGSACRKVLTNPFPAGLYYFNSFESAEDAQAWNGVTPAMFVEDPAPHSGKKSLQIGGGCIQPTAWIVLPKTTEERRYKLACWGKVDQPNQSGAVLLRVEGDPDFSHAVEISIKDQNWTYYESRLPLVCPKGKQLRLELRIGGIVFASMHIDALTIVY